MHISLKSTIWQVVFDTSIRSRTGLPYERGVGLREHWEIPAAATSLQARYATSALGYSGIAIDGRILSQRGRRGAGSFCVPLTILAHE